MIFYIQRHKVSTLNTVCFHIIEIKSQLQQRIDPVYKNILNLSTIFLKAKTIVLLYCIIYIYFSDNYF